MKIHKLIVIGFGIIFLSNIAYPDPNEIKTYMSALRRLIEIIEQIQITSRETDENTKAILEILQKSPDTVKLK